MVRHKLPTQKILLHRPVTILYLSLLVLTHDNLLLKQLVNKQGNWAEGTALQQFSTLLIYILLECRDIWSARHFVEWLATTVNIKFEPGNAKGEVSLYDWSPVWLVWNQLYDN